MFIIYKWAIFIHFSVRYLFIMRHFHPFFSSLFIHHAGCLSSINGPFSSIFQFTVYSSCLSSINGPFSSIFQFAIYSSCGMFIIYKWAIFIHFPVHCLFIMFIIYIWAIFIHFPVRYLFIMFITINGPFSCIFQFAIYSSCLSSMGNVHAFSSSLFILHVYHQWAIFIHFPVHCLFIMFIIYKWAIFIHFPVRYLFIMFITINGPFSCIFQFAIYSSCLSSMGNFHAFSSSLFIHHVYHQWAIFIHFPVHCLFIMFIIYKWAIFYPFSSSLFILHVYHLWMGNFYPFSSSLFIHHVYHQWAIFMHFPVRYLFIMFIINGPFSSIFQFTVYSSCLSSINGQFFIHFPVRYLFSMFIIYKWAIFMLFPVRYLFIMFITINGPFSCFFQFAIYSSCLSSMGHFHPFSSSLFIHHVYHL